MRIGFVGAGQMAQALVTGFLKSEQVRAADCMVSDPAATAIEAMQSMDPDIQVAQSNAQLMAECETVFLAVKPQALDAIVEALAPPTERPPLVVSIMAGVSLFKLQRALDNDRLIRAMPNTPALVGFGATAFASTTAVTFEEKETVRSLLESVGYVVEVPEYLIDAVTGLSGSGPAFVFQFLEALADGGVQAGLPRPIAMNLALHTVRGAAELVRVSGDHPAVLKDRVASPAGTTIEGIHALESGGLRSAVMQAVFQAAKRSEQLGSG